MRENAKYSQNDVPIEVVLHSMMQVIFLYAVNLKRTDSRDNCSYTQKQSYSDLQVLQQPRPPAFF